MKRIDERDIMFSRMSYKESTPEYEDYYKRNPDKKAFDDELRNMNNLCSPETPTYNPIIAPAANANFMFLSDIKNLVEGTVAQAKTPVETNKITDLIKEYALHYGALDVGICKANKQFFYSHRGRNPENYGDKIESTHTHAIVFTVKMDYKYIKKSPGIETCFESSKAYVDAAIIGMQLSYYIRNLGYDARCHMDGNYLLRARPLAVEAGLGQIGRNGLLVSKINGCCVRLGVVTCELPLIIDEPEDYQLQRFCKLCDLCSRNCPGKTVSKSDNPNEWYIDQEKCYKIWRCIGTDCGVCIRSCPISKGVDLQDIHSMTDEEIIKFIATFK